MEMSQYSGAAFLKVGDVKVSGPIRVVIADVVLGKYGKADVSFSDGTKLSLNATNNNPLTTAHVVWWIWSGEPPRWLGTLLVVQSAVGWWFRARVRDVSEFLAEYQNGKFYYSQ